MNESINLVEISKETQAKIKAFQEAHKFTPHGKEIEDVNEEVFDEDLKRTVVKKTSTVNIYEYIQASNNLTDMAQIQEQMIRTGQIPSADPDMVSADLSYLPTDIHQLHQVVNNVEKTFNELDPNVKGAFSGPQEFMSSLMDGSYLNKVNTYAAAQAAKAAAEAANIEKEGDK